MPPPAKPVKGAQQKPKKKKVQEFVFDPNAAAAGCAKVVSKTVAKENKKKRKKEAREKAIRAALGLKQTDAELKAEAKAAAEAETLDRNKVWRSIRALSASQLKGWKLREWKEKQRRELGAKASKTVKMPLKMREGILKKRKIVTAKVDAHLKEAGVVTTSHKGNKKKRMRAAAAAGRGGGADSGDVGNAGVRGGVMNVSYLLKRK